MKSLILIFMLALHATGLWTHVSTHTRSVLADASVGTAQTASVNLAPVASQALPVQVGNSPLNLGVASAYAIDTDTDTVLYSQDATAQRPIASITKLVTALVILSSHKTSDPVLIPKLPSYQTADQTIGLIPEETYQTGDLVKALLIYSADDAADALALADSGTNTKFAAKMNSKMTEWGITGAHFSNPSGLQDAGNYATAQALGKIAALAIKNPFILQAVGQSQTTITSKAGRTLNLTTTDDLLASGQFYGIKTGYTVLAGECFVGLTSIQGHQVITVVLGANDRFGSTQLLTNWIGSNWQWL